MNNNERLTVRLQPHIVLLGQSGGQHRVVARLESQTGKLTRVLEERFAGNTSCGQHFAGFVNAWPEMFQTVTVSEGEEVLVHVRLERKCNMAAW